MPWVVLVAMMVTVSSMTIEVVVGDDDHGKGRHTSFDHCERFFGWFNSLSGLTRTDSDVYKDEWQIEGTLIRLADSRLRRLVSDADPEKLLGLGLGSAFYPCFGFFGQHSGSLCPSFLAPKAASGCF